MTQQYWRVHSISEQIKTLWKSHYLSFSSYSLKSSCICLWYISRILRSYNLRVGIGWHPAFQLKKPREESAGTLTKQIRVDACLLTIRWYYRSSGRLPSLGGGTTLYTRCSTHSSLTVRLVALGTKQQKLNADITDSQDTRSQIRDGLDFPEWLLLKLQREWILRLQEAPGAHEAPQLSMDLSRSLHMLLLYSPISLVTSTSTLAAAGPCSPRHL